jgi:Tat protein translocase TatB subunit
VSGPSFWEFLLLCMIGLIVLGPKRLPQVANQIGSWVGHARRMTRTLKRQLEEELELDKPLNVRPAVRHAPPRDDDTYSPLHQQPPPVNLAASPERAVPAATGGDADGTLAGDSTPAETDSEQRQNA